jgi:hypothetical protein
LALSTGTGGKPLHRVAIKMFLVSRHFTTADGVIDTALGPLMAPLPLKYSTLFLSKNSMPPVKPTFTLLFGILHLVNIHLDIVHGNTVFGKVMNGIVIVVTALEQCLAGMQPTFKHNAAQAAAHFDTGVFNPTDRL